MKVLVRQILTRDQYTTLARLKQRFVRTLNHILVSAIKLFPETSLLALKSNIHIVKKMDYEPRDIFLTVESDLEYRVRLESCRKEPETVGWIETFLEEGDVLYDVGANVGAYSLVASKYFNGRVAVYAFEPAFPNFSQLCRNIVINGCQGSIIPFQIALSDKTTVENFHYQNLVSGGALHALGEAIDYKGDVFEPVFTQPVLSYRVDDFVSEFKIPVPNHMKIDVDGTEFAVLKGAEGTLVNSSLRSIFVELEEEKKDAGSIVGFLSTKGFEVHSKHKFTYGGEEGAFSNVHNYIFLRRC